MRLSNMIVVAAALATAAPAAAVTNFQVTFAAPDIQTSSIAADVKGVVTFDSVGTGSGSGTAGVGPLTLTTIFNPWLTVSYTNLYTLPAGANGGAGGTGRYSRAPQGGSTVIDIVTRGDRGINYFGMWISAFDSGNFVDFKRNGETIFTFTPTAVLAALGSCVGSANQATNGYCGNPNAGMPGIGTVAAEPYAFVNFLATNGVFDQILIRQNSAVNPNAGYQTDNHSFADTTAVVPEPASWALLIAGFGLVGAAMRRRHALAGA